MPGIAFFFNAWQQKLQAFLDACENAEFERAPIAERLRPDVDLCHARMARKELPVREIGPEQYKQVAAHHCIVPGFETDKSRHPDIIRIVVFDVLLATEGVNDRRLQAPCEFDHFIMGACAASAAEQRNPRARVEQGSQFRNFGAGRANRRFGGNKPMRYLRRSRLEGYVTGQYDDRNTLLRKCDSYGTC